MPHVIGIGTPYIDYFFELDKSLLKQYGLNVEDDFLFQEKNIDPKTFFKTHKILAESTGGISANTIAILQKLKIQSSFYGITGEDENGKFWLKGMGNIDISHITKKGTMSICACILSHKRKYRTFLSLVNPKDNEFFKSPDFKYLNNTQIIHVGPFFGGVEKGIVDLEKILKKVIVPQISFAPNSAYVNLGIEKLKPLLIHTDILFVNEQEVKTLTEKNPTTGSKKLLEYGPKIVVCTMGAKGALVTTKDQLLFTKGKKVKKVIDTTGAGDAFAAGFLYGILKKKSLKWSLDFANKIAAQSVSDFGLHWLNKVKL